MNYGPLVFLAALFAMAASWFGFVLTPTMQVGHMQQTTTVPAGDTYPLARSGLAREGLEVYRANGCAYCHSQQVRQTGTTCNVLVTGAGTNEAAVIRQLLSVKAADDENAARDILNKLPRVVLTGIDKASADIATKQIVEGGATAEVWVVPQGADIARGWGKRRTVAEDFEFDSPVLLGSQRVGPDLANVGLRLPDEAWHFQHFYAPRAVVPGSTMPPYRFLFQKRQIHGAPSANAIALPEGSGVQPGFEVVPTRAATALVAYLKSLRGNEPLYVAPLTVPPPPPEPASTNAPGNMASTNAPSTNTPAK